MKIVKIRKLKENQVRKITGNRKKEEDRKIKEKEEKLRKLSMKIKFRN